MKEQTGFTFLASTIRSLLFIFGALFTSSWGEAVESTQDPALSLPPLVIEESSLSAGITEPDRRVITHDEIQKTKRTHLIEVLKEVAVEVLKEVAGLDIVTSGGPGQNASLFIRGSRAEHTLVLIDGVEISDPTTTARVSDMSLIRTEQIERIEILKGPQTIRYGSDAVGGVIHITTLKGEGPLKSYYNLEGGSFRTQSGGWQGRGSRGPWNYNIGVQSYQSQGFSSADAGAGAERDSTHQSSFSTGLGYQFSDTTEMDVKLRNIRSQTDLDFSGGSMGDDPNYRSRSSQMLGAVKLRLQSRPDLNSWVAVSSNWIERNYRNEPDSRHPTDLEENFKSQNSKYETWHQYLVASDQTLELGLQLKEEYGSSHQDFNGVTQDMKKRAQSIFGQALIFSRKGKQDHWELALRHDQSSRREESLLNSSFMWSRDIENLNAVLRVQGGSGFKTPSLFQLYSQFGNENLKDEKVVSGDVSLQKQITSEAAVSVLYFENHFHDLIDFETTTSQYHNISKATAKGWELQLQMDSRKFWSGRAGGTWMETRDKTTGLSLLRRAHQSLFFNLHWDFSPWSGSVNYRWVGPRRDLDPQSLERIRLGSYDVVDLNGAFFWSPSVEIHGRVQNIFNSRHQELAGYQSSPLGVSMGIKGYF